MCADLESRHNPEAWQYKRKVIILPDLSKMVLNEYEWANNRHTHITKAPSELHTLQLMLRQSMHETTDKRSGSFHS